MAEPDRAHVTPLPELKRRFDQGIKGAPLHVRENSAEMDYFMARTGLQKPDQRAHGLEHLACLLSLDPAHPEWNALLAEYAQAGDLEPLLGKHEQPYFAYEAVRAWARAQRGELEAAISLLCNVVQAKPTEFLETWGAQWLEPTGAFERLARETAELFLKMALGRFRDAHELTVRQRDRAVRVARLAARFRFPPSDQLDMVMAGLHRKAGLFDEALAFARNAVKQRPSWHADLAEGLVLRYAGRTEEAEVAFRRAAKSDPTDFTCFLELGDAWFNREQWSKAAAAYEEALARDPKNAWATASLAWCKSPPRTEPSEPLLALAEGGNHRARDLCSRLSWYRGVLPAPGEATANMIAQLQQRNATAKQLAASDVESPSNLVALALLGQPRVSLSWGNVATPDPREPIGSIAYTLGSAMAKCWCRRRSHRHSAWPPASPSSPPAPTTR